MLATAAAKTAPAAPPQLLNFVVVGDVRSGTSVVQSSLSNRPGAVCHADLLYEHADPVHAAGVRRAAHEAYFGPCKDPKRPEWFVPEEMSPWQYINHAVLDNPRRGESAIGLRLLYPAVMRWELWELFETRCREGDFCVVHVVRNPVACLVSLKQAEHSGLWAQGWNSPTAGCPSPVNLEASELTTFCRQHISVRGKIRAACTDCLEVSYRDLFLDYQQVMRTVFDFLELPDSEEPAVAGVRRLRNRSLDERVSNWESLRQEVPGDVKQLLDAEDLF